MTTELEFSSPIAPPLPLWRISVAQYHQLGELGVLTPEDKVELLEGWIVNIGSQSIEQYRLSESSERQSPNIYFKDTPIAVRLGDKEFIFDLGLIFQTTLD